MGYGGEGMGRGGDGWGGYGEYWGGNGEEWGWYAAGLQAIWLLREVYDGRGEAVGIAGEQHVLARLCQVSVDQMQRVEQPDPPREANQLRWSEQGVRSSGEALNFPPSSPALTLPPSPPTAIRLVACSLRARAGKWVG